MSMASPIAPQDRNGFKIAIICALTLEAESVRAVFVRCWDDEGRRYGKAVGDKNVYTTGVIGRYNVVLVHLSTMGGVPAAQAAASLSSSFPNIELALVVGICGVVPIHPETKEDIVLGDVIISTAVTQYDYGRMYPGGFQRKGVVEDSLRKAPREIQGFINKLAMRQSRQKLHTEIARRMGSTQFQRDEPAASYPGPDRDHLYEASYLHQHRPATKCDKCHDDLVTTCSLDCNQIGCEEDKLIKRDCLSYSSTSEPELRRHVGPAIHLGRFGSANTVMKSGLDRDRIAEMEGLSAFEMEGAGVWDEHPTLVIKGACDYADSHKNKDWQPYAAMMAAVCLEVVLDEWVAADELAIDRPIWHVPYRRTSTFVGRASELSRLKQKVFDPDGGRVVSVFGLGGVGKSRLALELAYHVRSEHPQCSVFWIQGATQSTFETDVRDVGKQLGIPGIDDEKADATSLVKQWLSKDTTNRWILILDNADDEQTWGRLPDGQQGASSLTDWLPSTERGSIVLTTRTRGIANYLAGKEVVEVSEMPPKQAAELFTSGLEEPGLVGDEPTISKLMEQLACLPLAIVQASSFIRENQVTALDYLELLAQTEEDDVIELLHEGFEQPYGHQHALRPVATTWWISFKQIGDHHPLAATYLSWMACLHEKSIPLSLLPPDKRIRVVKAIAVLVGYSFIKKHEEGHGASAVEPLYDMHRLVHLCTRNWLFKEGKLAVVMEDCLGQVTDLFPVGEYEKKDQWTIYFPHGERLCNDEHVKSLSIRHYLLEKMANCLCSDGKFHEAARMFETVAEWRRTHLGLSDPETLRAYASLGGVLNDTGDSHRAQLILQTALAELVHQYGAECHGTLECMNNLAIAYRNQGRWQEAEELQAQVLKARRAVLGEEHPDTLISMSNLASTHHHQDRWQEAEELQAQVLKTRRAVLGEEHPDTLTSINNLALTYWCQGHCKRAEELGFQVLKTRRAVLGEEHPDTLISMSNLVSMYYDQARWKEAEELGRRVLERSRAVLGEEHPETMARMADLARILMTQNGRDEAVTLMTACVRLQEEVHGLEDPETKKNTETLTDWRKSQSTTTNSEENGRS